VQLTRALQLLDNFITETAREKAEVQKTEIEELRAKDNMWVLGVCLVRARRGSAMRRCSRCSRRCNGSMADEARGRRCNPLDPLLKLMATDYIDRDDLLAYLERLFLVLVQTSAWCGGSQARHDGHASGAQTGAKGLLEVRLTAEQLCQGFTSLPLEPPIHFSKLDFDTLVGGSLWGAGKSNQPGLVSDTSSVGVAEFQALMCAAVSDYVRRKLQRSVSETTTQEDFAHLAAVKILVADVDALNHRVSALAAAVDGALECLPRSPAARCGRGALSSPHVKAAALNGSRHQEPHADSDGDGDGGEASPRSKLERQTLRTYFGGTSVAGACDTAARAGVVAPSLPLPEPTGCGPPFCGTCAAYAAREEERARQREAQQAADKAERDEMRAEMRAMMGGIQAQWRELRSLFFAPLTAADRRSSDEEQPSLARPPSLTKAGMATPRSASEANSGAAPSEPLSVGGDPWRKSGKRLRARPVRLRVQPPPPYDVRAPNGDDVTAAGS